MDRSRSKLVRVTLTLAMVIAAVPTFAAPAVAVSPNVVISEVYGGGGNSGATLTNDFIELFNRGSEAVDLTGWSVQYASAAGTTWAVTALTGSIAPGGHYLIGQAAGAGGTTPLPAPDATGNTAMSATSGKVAVVSNSTTLTGACPLTATVDFVGYGTANCFEGTAAAPTLANTTSASRINGGATDTDDNAADFTTGAPNPQNSGDQPPTVSSTIPTDASAGFAVAGDLSINFSEPVNVSDSWFSIECSLSGSHTATVSGGSASYTLNSDTDFTDGDQCTVTVFAAGVSDQDTMDPPDAMAADFVFMFGVGVAPDPCALAYTPAYAIQGTEEQAAITGPVTTQGVVVGDYEGPSGSPTLRGFFIQDALGDGITATSDGIFIFEGSGAGLVQLGDVVRVTGNASDFQGQTQVSASSVHACGTGSVEPVDVTLPAEDSGYFEQFEGMLVRLPQTLFVTEHFQLGRFGQVVVSSGDRLIQPTSVVAPGDPANAMQAANNLNRIIIDDASQAQNPDPILFARNGQTLSAENTLRGGDTVTGLIGVLNFTWAGNAASGNAYRVRPINALGGGVPIFSPANPRPTGVGEVGGTISAATLNLLNYFNTFTSCTFGVGGPPADCRGADNQTEFDRQWPKTVKAVLGSEADVIGVNEIENDGYGPSSAVQDLVNRLNAATAPGAYAFIDFDAATGQTNALGTDAIKVGLIYRTAAITPVGTTAVLNTTAFVNGGDGDPRNRATYAQAFADEDGGVFVISGNHLKSKGSPCDIPDQFDGQGNCSVVRTNAANLLADFLASDPTGTGERDILILGDLNSYAKEDPISALISAGYANLVLDFQGEDAYSFVFDAQWGYLDHAMGYSILNDQVTGVAEWHINSDEPSVLDYNTDFKSPGQILSLYEDDEFRSADHDPLVVGLSLQPTYPFSGFGPPVANYPAENSITAGSTRPVKFSLGANEGTDVLELAEVVTVDCETKDELGRATATGTLTYSAGDNQYTFAFETEKSWAGSCRVLEITLDDGTLHRALFTMR